MSTLSLVDTHLAARPRRPLTREDETALAKRIAGGDRLARQQLIEANLGLVTGIARRHRAPGVEYQDLVQEGVLGLIRATAKFDHTKGFRFGTYASWWIGQAMQRAIRDQSRTIRLPASAAEKVRSIRKAEGRLTAALGHAPDTAQLCDETGLSRDKLAALQLAAEPPSSLDAAEANGAPLPGEPTAEGAEQGAERALELSFRRRRLAGAIAELPDPRQRRVLELHYGLAGGEPRTLKEVGEVLGLTAARICQLEQGALAALRSRLAVGAEPEPEPIAA